MTVLTLRRPTPAVIRRVPAPSHPRLLLGCLAGVLVLAGTGWIAPALAAAAGIVAGPWLFGTSRADRGAAAVEDAVNRWVDALRDLIDAGASLADALTRTLASPPPAIRAPLDALAARLGRGEPLDEALDPLARDLANPGADRVVATLQLHARAGSGQLADVLTMLADTLRQRLRLRRRVDADRAGSRTETRQTVAVIVLSLALLAHLDAAFLAPLRTARGQTVLAFAVTLDVAAVLLLRRCAVFPASPRVLDDIAAPPARAVPAPLAGPARDLARWAAPIAARRGWPSAHVRADLALLGRSPDDLAVAQAAGALLGAAAGLLLGVAVGGLLLPAWLVVLFAAVGAVVPYSNLRRDAAARRQEFRGVLIAYLELARVCVAGGAGLAEALWSAASAGRGPHFAALRGALLDARTSRQSYPEALDALATTINLPELADVAATLALTDTAGTPAALTLRAQVSALQDAELNAIRATAGRRTAAMTWARILLAASYIVTIGYPALAAVSAATH